MIQTTSPAPNIRTVAAKAKVSVATVSRVFSGTPTAIRISAGTAERVRKVAKEMGYYPTPPPARCGSGGRGRSACSSPARRSTTCTPSASPSWA